MSKKWLWVSLATLVAVVFVSGSHGQETTIQLPAIGGGAASPDNTTLVVALTAKSELVFFDTMDRKETKRVSVDFQPTQVAWGDKVLFVGQKSSGIVHVLDAKTGKELGKGNAGGAVRNLIVVKGVCFASTSSREVSAIDAKGKATKAAVQGTYIAADPKGEFVYTCIEGKATTDIQKHTFDGTQLKYTDKYFRSLRSSLIKVQGIGVSQDGKAFGVAATVGWTDRDNNRHLGIPLYDTDDMKSQLGELELGGAPSGFAVHPVLPLMFACTSKDGAVFNAKSYASIQKLTAPREGGAVILAFVGKGQKLAWGTTNGDQGSLKFVDLKLTKDQQTELTKVYSGK